MGTANAQTDSEYAPCENYVNGCSIEAFFAESVILVSGATGFLGKALLEKLLRSCPRLSTIFVLIRPKRGETVEQRFKNLVESNVFDRVRWEYPEALNKMQPIKGDVSLVNLGLSIEDRNTLIEKVNIVFHSAATVRFNEPLKVAINLNTRGTDRMIDLSRSMKNLISFIHVSTAYCNADKAEIKELVYTSKIKPTTVMEMCENLDDETLEIIEKKLVEKHPNTYTFTKNLAEQLLLTKGADLPIAIVRPSIIGAASEEPFPGWVDNYFGVTGIMMAVSTGTLRSIMCDKNLIGDIVPVDYVVDTIICASWHSITQRNKSIKVYNCTSGTINPLRWGKFCHLVQQHAWETPTADVLWYPTVTLRTSKIMHFLESTALHFLPAYVVDTLLKLKGNEPMMLKQTKRTDRAVKSAEFFATRQWNFQYNNMCELMKSVEASNDCERFNVDIGSLDWDAYMCSYMLGIRKYLTKDTPETLGKARNRLSKLYWMHRFTQVLSIFLLLTMIIRIGR